MGATFVTMKLPATLDKDAVKRQFAILQEQDRHDNGHSYSGGFGMCDGISFLKETFANVEGAEKWITDRASKWGPAMAVKVDAAEKPCWFVGAWCAE